MKHLSELMQLCIEHDAVFEVQNRTVEVIKYKGEWYPNARPIIWASCCVDDIEAIERIKEKLCKI